MDELKNPTMDAAELPARHGTNYPAPFDAPCAAREKRALGDAFGLTHYGVNSRHAAAGRMVFAAALALARGRVDLCAGRPARAGNRCWSARRLSPASAGFPAGADNGHHLRNETDRPVAYLEVGSRRPDDDVEYSDIDMRRIGRTGDPFRHKDGTPYG